MDNIRINSVKASFQNHNHDYIYQNKKCILLVSVGQPYHEAEKLLATIQLINRSEFSQCTIAIADTLQRHNFPDKSAEEAYRYSLLTGDEWLKRNDEAISQLKPAVEILRWDAVLKDPHYPSLKQQIEFSYQTNSIYRNAIEETIGLFLNRVKKRNEAVDLESLGNHCREYLLEECPIIMPLWAAQGYDFIIYPKPLTTAMAATRELFVTPYYADKTKWLSLKFKRLSIAVNEPVSLKDSEQIMAKI